jgi:TM2 domain-containing membrane protein YozV
MNFAIWLLKRMKRKLLGDPNSQSLCSKFRDFMQDEFAGAIVITLLLGIGQFILGAIIVAWICEGHPPMWTFYMLLANPFIFFFYNWLVLLYGYYDNERMATWNRLKE